MPPRTYRHWLISALILLAGLLITGLLQLQATHRIALLGQQQFSNDSQQLSNRLQQRLTEFGYLLTATSALYKASDSVSRAELHTFIQGLSIETLYPDLLSIGYFQPQAAANEPQQIDIVRTPKGLTAIAPIIYATGHDPFNEPARAAALNLARSSGKAVLTDKMALPDPSNLSKSHTGFMLYLPVYRHDCLCTDQSTRLKQHIGWVHVAFRASDLLQNSADNSDIDLVLYDGTSADDNTLAASYRQNPDHTPRYNSQQSLNVFGHSLLLRLYSSAAYENRQSLQNADTTTLWSGAFISLLLAVMAWIMVRSHSVLPPVEASNDEDDDSTKTIDQQKQEHVLKTIYVRADKLLLNIMLLLLLVSAGIGVFHDSALLTLVIGVPLVASVYWLTHRQAGSLLTRCSIATVMMLLVALQIQQSHGMIETHFAVFIVLSFLLFYRDWRPIAVAVGVTTLHHTLFNSLQSMGWPVYLFDHGNDFERVAIHIAYVSFEACALIYRAIDTKQQLL
jgi:CHASE1-domain containing sensor protein